MKRLRGMQTFKMLVAGAIMLQAGGCGFDTFLDVVQTVLLGVTAAGSVAILQNI